MNKLKFNIDIKNKFKMFTKLLIGTTFLSGISSTCIKPQAIKVKNYTTISKNLYEPKDGTVYKRTNLSCYPQSHIDSTKWSTYLKTLHR